MKKKSAKLLVSALMLAGAAAALGMTYYAGGDSAQKHDDCPAFATNVALFMNSGQNGYQIASRVTEQVAGQSLGAPSNNGPIARNNFIDDYIFGKMEQDNIPHADLCTNEEFIRRAYLDIIGRIPSSDEVRAFAALPNDPATRADLVNRLLTDDGFKSQYVDRWTMFFGDLYQNASSILYNGRIPYYNYIYDFVQKNKPYNQVVTELLTSIGYSWDAQNGPVNFLARAWENMVNQADMMDNIAVNSGRMFLGVPVLCISCHSGPGHLDAVNLYLSTKKRQDLWGLSAFFSGLRYTRDRETQNPNTFSFTFTEQPSPGYDVNANYTRNGIRPQRRVPPNQDPIIPPSYFFTQEAPSNGADFRTEFARILTSDFQFARATVNNIWKEMMGVGIVDPPDAFDLARLDPNNPPTDPRWQGQIQPTHPELLDRLAQEFIDSGYDIQHMIQFIANSSAYQLSARFNGQWEGQYAQYFARHFAKRMTAEQLTDAVFKATGLPGNFDIDNIGPIQWTMQLPDPSEPRGNGEAANVRNFLNLFNRGNRDTSVRRPEGSILQALALMNNGVVVNRIKNGGGGLVDTLVSNTNLSNEQVVEELFLATLSRYPTKEEKNLAVGKLQEDRAQGAETMHLALINKLDFIFY